MSELGSKPASAMPTVPSAPTESKARELAAKVWQEVAKNEETRFSNLNTRALGVVTLSGVVTSIGGFFAKDLQSSIAFDGTQRLIVAALLIASLSLLVVSIGVAVIGVLVPGGRLVFGDNEMTGPNSGALCVDHINQVVHDDYYQIATRLKDRNISKATCLRAAYWIVATGILLIAVAGVVYAGDAIVGGPPIK